MNRNLIFLCAASILGGTASTRSQTAPEIKRTPILTAEVSPSKTVDHVQVTRLDFKPGQITGRHMHPVPVIGYVESGVFLVKIEGQIQQRYTAGQAIYEPANTTIERYDNESSTEPAVLIAYYLAGAKDQVLIKFLPPR
jgi:quercetin dioxygenase-like cupin family protein